ncbi:MAG: DUF3037 domain-containing protein [Gomphosphaeria aponina SAG 52.96 = DSM 107014]|uniref:DUF3037 domain-containing protein n=1 Tax=Gomphosphaeria aponina SAG 52.96 = DSM 107014 TaxID=1521640 RepID=A0A941GXG4_9CHRO|nr:DUF3037 domain-containing protein [Gomphosphaeria aponina SAG 52.96 = DSM 107014]
MVSRYSIIQYVPNPIIDERINIGVLAFDDQVVKVKFSENWQRVSDFAMEDDLEYLKNFAHRMKECAKDGLLFPGDIKNKIPKHERLLKVAQGWMNSIQFTEPRGSLKNVDKLFTDTVNKFLIFPPKQTPKNPHTRDRQAAARLTVSKIQQAAKKVFGDQYQHLVKAKYAISGKYIPHKMDIAIANGHPYLAAQGISFEVNPPPNLLDALSWTITDIKEKNPSFPLAVVLLPPKQDLSKNYETLAAKFSDRKAIYQDLGAIVLQEDEVYSWAINQLNSHWSKV